MALTLPSDIDFVKNKSADPARMNVAMLSLHARLVALELPAKTIDDVLATIQQVGLERVNNALQPYYQQLAAVVSQYETLTQSQTISGGTLDAPVTRIANRRSTTAGDVPTDLVPGEIGINQADGLVYWKDALGVIQSTPLLDVITASILTPLLAAKAPLASPALTGTPTAPTATAGDISTKIANTSFVNTAVQAAISALLNGAPVALDTLKELADALGDDANYAATTATALGNRVRIDAPQTLTPAQLAQVYSNLNKDDVGSVTWHAANTPPIGKLKANGAAVSRTAYANLFARIGTAFGAGDGSTTFNLPDLRGCFIRGWDNGRGLDSTANRAFGSYQADQFASHSHGASATTTIWPTSNGNWPFMAYAAGAGNVGYTTGNTMAGSGGTASTTVTIGASGGGETNPKNYALLPCIQF